MFFVLPVKNAFRGAALFNGMACEHMLPFVINVHHWCIHMDIPHQKKRWWDLSGDKLGK